MATFWCVFWWVLLGFLLGWLCNWLLSRWLGGDDDGRGVAYKPVGTPPPSNSGESSGVNWQTQMVDKSRPIATTTTTTTTSDSTADKGVLGVAAAAVGTAAIAETSVTGKVVDGAVDTDEAVAEGAVDTVVGAGEATGDDAADVAEDTADLPSDAADTVADEDGAVIDSATEMAEGSNDLTSNVATSAGVLGVAGATSYFANEKQNTQANKSFGAIDKIADDENAKDGEDSSVASSVIETNNEPVSQPVAEVAEGGTGLLFAAATATGAVAFDKAAAKAAGFRVKGEDDLTVVEGIGPKINKLFNDAGIHTFAELSQTPVEKMQEILDAAGPRYRLADPTTWGQQAGLAAQNSWAELKELQDRLDGGRLV